MKKIITVCLLLFYVSCSKSEGFTLQSFDSQIRQTLASAKGLPSTEIVTTINGVAHTLNLTEDLFYDLDEDEYVHLLQNYSVEFEVDDTFINVQVFFNILTDRENNAVVTRLPSGTRTDIAVENTMQININGETTVVNIDEAVVNFPNVRFDDGKYSFDISL